MAADREAYAARQAELLAALLGAAEPPAGFDAEQAAAAGRSLRRKRAQAVRHAWPALAVALGDKFDERFDAFARTAGPPAFGHGLTDGLAFASSRLERDALHDDVRVELLLARSVVMRPGDGADAEAAWRARRGAFVGAQRLSVPYRRLLVVVRLPWLGSRHLVVRQPQMRRPSRAPRRARSAPP